MLLSSVPGFSITLKTKKSKTFSYARGGLLYDLPERMVTLIRACYCIGNVCYDSIPGSSVPGRMAGFV